MEFILKEAVGFNGIKGGITKEGIIVKIRVEGKEIRENRPEGRGITNGFILIRGIRFLFYSLVSRNNYTHVEAKGGWNH